MLLLSLFYVLLPSLYFRYFQFYFLATFAAISIAISSLLLPPFPSLSFCCSLCAPFTASSVTNFYITFIVTSATHCVLLLTLFFVFSLCSVSLYFLLLLPLLASLYLSYFYGHFHHYFIALSTATCITTSSLSLPLFLPLYFFDTSTANSVAIFLLLPSPLNLLQLRNLAHMNQFLWNQTLTLY